LTGTDSLAEAERVTYEAIAPEYLNLSFFGAEEAPEGVTPSDPALLSDLQIQIRQDSVRQWELRVEETPTAEDDQFFLTISPDYLAIVTGELNPETFTPEARQVRADRVAAWEVFVTSLEE
jgi:hypothetical protein